MQARKKRWGSRKEKKTEKNKRHSVSMNHFESRSHDVISVEKRSLMATSLYLVTGDDDEEEDYVQVISAPIAHYTANITDTGNHSTVIQPSVSPIDTNDLVC